MALSEKLQKFAFSTVLKPTFYESDGNGSYTGSALFTLESLSISNFTQEGPMKTAKGGLNANTVLRYGKTARLEMEDVIGQIAALEALMGVTQTGSGTTVQDYKETFVRTPGTRTIKLSKELEEINDITDSVGQTLDWEENTDYAIEGNSLILLNDAPEGDVIIIVDYDYFSPSVYTVTNKFATPKYIEGTTFVVNATTGNREWIKVTIPSFLPDSLYNITMEAEGDFGVMNVAGEVQVNDCGEFFFLGDEDNPC